MMYACRSVRVCLGTRAGCVRSWLLVAGIVAVVVTSGCASTGSREMQARAEARWNAVRADVKLQLAGKQFEGGLFEHVLQTAAEAMVDDPTNAEAYVLVAQSHLELGASAQAWRVLSLAEQAGVSSAGLAYTRGVLLEQRGALDQAAASFAEAMEQDPTIVDHLVAYVECQVSAGRPDLATQALEVHAGQFEDGATIPLLAGHVAAAMGKAEEAGQYYREAYVRASDNALVAETLGLWLMRTGRPHEAIGVLESLVASCNKSNDEAGISRAGRLALARAYLIVDRPGAARRVVEAFAIANPQHRQAQMLLGKAAIALGDMMLARRMVYRLDQLDPHDPEAALLRATILYAEERYAEAIDLLYDLLAGRSDDVDVHCLLAESLRSLGELAGARRQFEEALALDATCAWAAAGLDSLKWSDLPPAAEPIERMTDAGPR